jgi:hypothetical protein
MPKGIPKRPGEEQLLEGGGAGAGMGRSRKKVDAFEMTDAQRAELSPAQKRKLGSDLTFDRSSRVDPTIAKLRAQLGVDGKSSATKREVTPSPRSVLEEAERNKALDKFRRDKALEEATTEGGVTKYPYVEPTEKKKGGLTASRRADGIASRGKTRGRIV